MRDIKLELRQKTSDIFDKVFRAPNRGSMYFHAYFNEKEY